MMLWPVQVAQPRTTTWTAGQEFEGYLRWQSTTTAAVSLDLERVDRAAFNAPGGSIFVDATDLEVGDDQLTPERGLLRGRFVEESQTVLVPPGLPVSRGSIERIMAFSELFDRIDGRYVRRAGMARSSAVPTTHWEHALPDDPPRIQPRPVPATGLECMSNRQYEQRFPERVPAQQWRSGGFVLWIEAEGRTS